MYQHFIPNNSSFLIITKNNIPLGILVSKRRETSEKNVHFNKNKQLRHILSWENRQNLNI